MVTVDPDGMYALSGVYTVWMELADVIRPDAVRIGVTATVGVIAFAAENRDGSVGVVAVNTTPGELMVSYDGVAHTLAPGAVLAVRASPPAAGRARWLGLSSWLGAWAREGGGLTL